jgi:anti-sigma regulatory factor (Ser/Thr protein kinase)
VREIALHLLDIAENSVSAGAKRVEINVEEDLPNDRLRLAVQDDGRGMEAELLAQVSDPFTTSRTTRRVGLGIPLLKAAAEACRGSLKLNSSPGEGTCLVVEFQRSHIDRMPLGDLAGTMLTLIVGFPQVHWVFKYRVYPQQKRDPVEFVFDDEPVKQVLAEVSLTEPDILSFLRQSLREGIAQVQREIFEDHLRLNTASVAV